jgi:hypothetical protein
MSSILLAIPVDRYAIDELPPLGGEQVVRSTDKRSKKDRTEKEAKHRQPSRRGSSRQPKATSAS